MIPKLIHLYWGRNRPLSYMRWLTAASTSALNPDWQIVVHYPTHSSQAITWKTGEQNATVTTRDYFPELQELPNVCLMPVAADYIGVADSVPEVIKSDLFRWRLLAETGGVWSDFDILYFRPLAELRLAPETMVVLCCQLLRNKCYNSIGFMAAVPESGWRFFSDVYEAALQDFSLGRYQGAGREILDRFHGPEHPPPNGVKIVNLPANIVYPIPARAIACLLCRDAIELPPATIGLHWFAGDRRIIEHEPHATPEAMGKKPGALFRYMHAVGSLLRRGGGNGDEVQLSNALLRAIGAVEEYPEVVRSPLPPRGLSGYCNRGSKEYRQPRRSPCGVYWSAPPKTRTRLRCRRPQPVDAVQPGGSASIGRVLDNHQPRVLALDKHSGGAG